MNLESYPPVFRQQNGTTTDQNIELDDDTGKETEEEEEEEEEDTAPVINLQSLSEEKIGDACKDWGLFRLANHGVPLTLLTQIQEHARELFAFSFETKQALFTTPLSYFWGTPALTPSGAALSRGGLQNINWVEGFNVPLCQLSQFRAGDPTLESFRILLEDYGRHLERLATTLFGAIAKTLNLDPEQSKSALSESTGFIRVYRYPKCPISNDNEGWGMDVHTDSSVLSILNQDQVGGLDLLKDGKWVGVKPIPDTLVVNLGDMMQAISNDEYESVKHRVRLNKCKERLSICYFVFPAEGKVIQSSKYKPFTYSDFQAQVQQDVKNLGYKVGLERFKLSSPRLVN